jgi:ABC-type nitrate/sulfonate/bicarbonate transport system substrate-binding protein
MTDVNRRQFLSRSATGAAGLMAFSGLSALLASCGSDSRSARTGTGAASSNAGSGKAGAVTMQAAWVNDAEFTGYFVGMDQGLYRKAGIDLTYLPGGPSVIPESTLAAGRADLALTTPDTTIKAIADEGAKFKIIGTQFQKNPLGVVSLKKNAIRTPRDLVGKKLAVPDVNRLAVLAMLKLNGIDPSQVTLVPYQYDPTPLIKGEVDATIDFTANVPFTIQQKGEEPFSFLLFDAGFPIFNDTVVVTEETLKNKRADLVSWLRASRQSWVENFKDPAKYPPRLRDTWFKGTGRTVENELFFNKAQQPLIEAPGGIYSMSEEAIEANLKALRAIGIKGERAMFDTTLLAEV